MDYSKLSDEELIMLKKQRSSLAQPKNADVAAEFQGVHPVLKGYALNANVPLRINSGMRTPEENARVGGVPSSKHLTGNAIDVAPSPEAASYFKKGGFPVLDEGDHLHVSMPNYADLTDEQLIALKKQRTIKKQPPATTQPQNTQVNTAPSSLMDRYKKMGTDSADLITKSLPVIGGIGGSILGGPPGGVLGALLGYSGERAIDTVRGKRQSPGVIGEFQESRKDIIPAFGQEILPPVISKVAGPFISRSVSRLKNEAGTNLAHGLEISEKEMDKIPDIGTRILNLFNTPKSEKGLGKLSQQSLDESNIAKEAMLSKHGKSKIDMTPIGENLAELRAYYASTSPTKVKDIKKIDMFIDDFKRRKGWWADKKNMTVEQMQVMKENLGGLLKKHFGKDNLPLTQDIDMAIQHGYQRSLENAMPGIKGVNKDLQTGIVLKDALKSKDFRDRRKSAKGPTWLESMLAAAVGVPVGLSAGPFAGVSSGLAASAGARAASKTIKSMPVKTASALIKGKAVPAGLEASPEVLGRLLPWLYRDELSQK